jgi:hypothetical protein
MDSIRSGTISFNNPYFTYEGDYVISPTTQPHGHGILYFGKAGCDGYLQGEFQNGQLNGAGKKVFGETVYEGQFANGHMNGVGVLTKPGQRYSGQFLENKFHGDGVLEVLDHSGIVTSKYEGSFVSHRQHGDGKLSLVNGDVYVGAFVSGGPEGYGSMQYASGHVYEGEWRNQLRNGVGRFFKPPFGCSVTYAGAFRDNLPTLRPEGLSVTVAPWPAKLASPTFPALAGFDDGADGSKAGKKDKAAAAKPSKTAAKTETAVNAFAGPLPVCRTSAVIAVAPGGVLPIVAVSVITFPPEEKHRILGARAAAAEEARLEAEREMKEKEDQEAAALAAATAAAGSKGGAAKPKPAASAAPAKVSGAVGGGSTSPRSMAVDTDAAAAELAALHDTAQRLVAKANRAEDAHYPALEEWESPLQQESFRSICISCKPYETETTALSVAVVSGRYAASLLEGPGPSNASSGAGTGAARPVSGKSTATAAPSSQAPGTAAGGSPTTGKGAASTAGKAGSDNDKHSDVLKPMPLTDIVQLRWQFSNSEAVESGSELTVETENGVVLLPQLILPVDLVPGQYGLYITTAAEHFDGPSFQRPLVVPFDVLPSSWFASAAAISPRQ